ncbi:hypothetical protein HYV10_01630 [Candidatus Dependentiae bacterium]|nr:hypothetical protein [Candidatus Dependentiae bacterium]
MLKFFSKKSKIIFLLAFFHNFIFSTNVQKQFYNLYLPQRPTKLYFPDNSEITLKNQSSHLLLLMYWQERIIKGFSNFFSKIEDDLDMSIEQLLDICSNDTILKEFNSYQQKKLSLIYSDPNTVLEDEIDSSFLSFLKENIAKYIPNSNIEIILNPNVNYVAKSIYDSKSKTYIIILNSMIYKLEFFAKIKSPNFRDNLYFSKENLKNVTSSTNYKDLIYSGFIMVASTIYHQFDLLCFVVSNYKFHGLEVSNDTLTLLSRLISFQLDLEIIFQSDNPLDIAYFYQSIDHFVNNQKHWSLLIKNIEAIYEERSLEKFQKIISSRK